MHGMPNHAFRASSALHLRGIALKEAERLLTAIWCVLEAHALPSPTLEVREVGPGASLIDISLIFGSAEDCSLVQRCWQSALRGPRQAQLPPHHQPSSNLAPQTVKRAKLPVSAKANVRELPPINPEPAPQSQASALGEGCPSSMPAPERASRGCRFITGDPSDFHALGEAIYCGSPVERIGEPWCVEHRRICYVRPRAGGLSGTRNVV